MNEKENLLSLAVSSFYIVAVADSHDIVSDGIERHRGPLRSRLVASLGAGHLDWY